VVRRRLASALSAPDSKAVVTASSNPKSRNATKIERSVKMVRVFLRNKPAQRSGR
jgi:hypothetical protein